VMVGGSDFSLVRRRETVDDLVVAELSCGFEPSPES
jgi:hypothetical protein